MVPPSNISQSVKRLERELGTVLFTRKPNSITLTERGTAFYKMVEKALGLIDEAAILAQDNGSTGEISISINVNRRPVMAVIELFKKRYPDVTIKIAHFGNTDLEDFDVVIDDEGFKLEGYTKKQFITESIAVAINGNSPLAKKQGLDISELKNEPFITMDKRTSHYRLTKLICADHGFNPRIAIQSDDPFYVRKCVQLALGVSLVPTISWRGLFSEEIVLKATEYTRNTYIYVKDDSFTPLCVKNFLTMLTEKGNEYAIGSPDLAVYPE